ncbi:hypothetical protein ET445_07610 [Agromyces protaetiae]|uniref:Uncharacterized protein n=1 Tax=Agromyces protaetiae TaxID=2509455 RepID=A0A4P6FBM9_9MICO|nr:hypothetical protein [Agromyces protaetiae]QAY73234.1 hypothetical protein ET445_07610 [Agromyces protaetiae]
MTDAPQSKPARSRPRGVHPAAVLTAAVAIVAAALASFVFFPPQPAERAEAVAPVFSAHEPGATALAGAHRGALAASAGLRAATVDLAGFADQAILDDTATVLAALDEAATSGDPTALLEATALFESIAPALVERFAADAEGRLTGYPLADGATAQAVRDAAAALRSAEASDLAGRFAPLRAAVEAAAANHAQAEAAAAEAAARASGGSGSGGSGRTGGGAGGSPDASSTPNCALFPRFTTCGPPPVVTALGSYVASCPPQTLAHVFQGRSETGPVTLDFSFTYTYRIDGHFVAVMHCDPEPSSNEPHGPGPLPEPYSY